MVSHLDVKNESISNLITPKTANDIGDRIILIPQEINAIATPIIIHPVNVFSKDCSPHPKTRVLNQGKLSELRCALEAFSKAISSNENFGDIKTIEEALKHFDFTHGNFVNKYTLRYEVKQDR